jgi:protein gp37
MAAKTSIEWAANADGTPGATWNPIRARDTVTGKTGTFCVHKSPGCEHCYAEIFQGRSLPNNGIGLAYTAQNLSRVEFYLDEKILEAPARRRKPTTFFISSMTDLFGEWMTDAMIDQIMGGMVANERHTFIVVTKRADRMRQYFTDLPKRQRELNCDAALDFIDLPLRNVWLVVSCEDQRRADERIPDLLATPAAVRGLSCEPLLGPIDIIGRLDPGRCGCEVCATTSIRCTASRHPIDWVIAGGESGPKARPMHPDWARGLRDQCAAAGVPFFYKQTGEWTQVAEDEAPERFTDPRIEQFRCVSNCGFSGNLSIETAFLHKPRTHPDCFPVLDHEGDGEAICNPVLMRRVGKTKAGRLLDGREHNERPPLAIERERSAA